MEEHVYLLWDDIEAHLNPRILLRLAGWFSDIIAVGKQVILVTHSMEALRLIAGAVVGEKSIVLLYLKDNILKTKSYSESEVEEMVEAGIDLRLSESFLL
jgi:predicted ATP-dependent endonuclease of OLD family